MNSYVNLHMNSYVIAFLDMNTQNVHTATAKFCLRPSYKRIPSHKMFASDDKILSLKSLLKHTQLAKFSPAAAQFYLTT